MHSSVRYPLNVMHSGALTDGTLCRALNTFTEVTICTVDCGINIQIRIADYLSHSTIVALGPFKISRVSDFISIRPDAMIWA